MSKPVFFKSLKEASKACKKLGIDTSKMRTMAEMSAAYNKANAGKSKLAVNKPIPYIVPKGMPDSPIMPDDIQGLIAAAKSEREPSAKVDLLSQLSAKQYAAMNAETDAVKKTDLMRQWQATQKAETYARLAAREANPKAAKISRLLDLAS